MSRAYCRFVLGVTRALVDSTWRHDMNLDLTIDEKNLLIKLLLKAEEFSLTSYAVDLDLTPNEQERVRRLLMKLRKK